LITIQAEILIDAPLELCFDLAIDMDVHVECERQTKERVVGGRVHGKLKLGETVTFEAMHFGIRQRLISKIIAFDRPDSFVDQMQEGAFYFLRHTHTFQTVNGGTLMHDKLDIAAPFGPLGWIAERLFLRQYMLRFLHHHQREFKIIVEAKDKRKE